MKRTLKILFLLAALTALTAAGCMKFNQPRLKIEYYTLEYEPVISAETDALPVVIHVERFTSAPLYNTSRMLYREKAFSMDGYHYHKWRAIPADLVSYFIARDMGASRMFEAVFPPDATTASTHVLSGSVNEFYERDFPDRWEAVVSITVSLLQEEEPDPTKRLVFQKTYSSVERCEEKTPASVAEAMSRAMAHISHAVISDIHRALSQNG